MLSKCWFPSMLVMMWLPRYKSWLQPHGAPFWFCLHHWTWEALGPGRHALNFSLMSWRGTVLFIKESTKLVLLHVPMCWNSFIKAFTRWLPRIPGFEALAHCNYWKQFLPIERHWNPASQKRRREGEIECRVPQWCRRSGCFILPLCLGCVNT